VWSYFPSRRSSRVASVGLAAVALLAVVLWSTTGTSNAANSRQAASVKPTIVLVHGAWANSSSWDPVIGRLQQDGYTVDAPPNPLRGVQSDSAYLASYLKTIQGPVVLVGHSYGGFVTTDAAVGDSNVKALVYVDAYIPAQGDTLNSLTAAMPGSMLGQSAFNAVPFGSGAGDVDLYIKQSLFPSVVANGLPASTGAKLAAEQEPLAAAALSEPSGPPAWKSIKSWDVIGMNDHVLPPAEQLAMAHRAHSKVTEVNAPHLAMLAQPAAITKVIEQAADGS
jgi:pimeloyl-ACP methyl ester carboxylesterase